MILNGEINTFLNALGCKQGDIKILDVITLIASDFEIEDVKYEGVSNVYFHFFKSGVDFTFDLINDCEILSGIFIYVKDVNGYSSYPFLKEFIHGLYNGIKKEVIIELLGEEKYSGKNWIKYSCNNNYIHFEFDEVNELSLITLFRD
ncbi:hypothetical protein RYD26_12405 [Pasteurellaceae bacterium LIM206]|nr:hypothetical protein [Pasteurellaceae bacterium LIM206]